MLNAAPTDEWVALAFMERYLKDREAGKVVSVEEYIALWPDHSDTVLREFRLIEKGEPPKTTVEAKAAPADFGPRELGPYTVLEEIGRGGQAVVYLAEDTRLGRRVALKVLRSLPGLESHAALARFRREAMAASKIEHPAICGVHDVGQADGLSYVAMPLIAGETLAKRLPKERGFGKPMWAPFSSRDRLLAYFEEAAAALHATHGVGVLHRDIKPGNLMLTPGERPMILDFGLAQEIDQDQRHLTLTGDILGTPSYLAPEQISGSRIPLDPRVDVWALGVTLYEVLTKSRPFDAPSRAETYRAIMTKDPIDPRSVDPGVDRDLRAIVLTAPEKDRDRRYQSAQAFAEDLGRARRGEPVHARPAGPLYRTLRLARRHPVVSASLAVALLSLVTGLVVSLLLLRTANEATQRLSLAQEQDRARLVQIREVVRALATSLTQELRYLPAAADYRGRLADQTLATLRAVERSAEPEPALVIEMASALREKAQTQCSPQKQGLQDSAAARATLAEARSLIEGARRKWPKVTTLVCEAVAIELCEMQMEWQRGDFASVLRHVEDLDEERKVLLSLKEDPWARRLVCLLLEQEGDGLARTGDANRARERMELCRDLRQEMLNLQGVQTYDQFDLGLIWLKLGQIEVNEKRAGPARAALDQALLHAERYAVAHPESVLAQDRLADVWRLRAYLRSMERDLAGAIVAWQMSARFQSGAARATPGGVGHVDDVLTAYQRLQRAAEADEDTELERRARLDAVVAEAEAAPTTPHRRVKLARQLLDSPSAGASEQLTAYAWMRRAVAETERKDAELLAEFAVISGVVGEKREARAAAREALDGLGEGISPEWKSRLQPLLGARGE